MNTIMIKGVISTVGPLSIKLPVQKGAPESQWGNFPVETRGLDADGHPLLSGYLPGTTLRGFVRRAVVTHRMQEAAAAGRPYSLPQAYAELIGQDSASEKNNGPADLLKLRALRDSNPVLDLFGVGLGLSSRLLVSRFRPQHLVMPEITVMPRKDLEDTDGVLDLLPEADRAQYLGRTDANSKRSATKDVVADLKRKIKKAEKAKDPVEDLKTALAAAEVVLTNHTEAMGEMTNSSRTLAHYWALPSGLDLSGQLIIEKARERDLAMLELALNALSLRPILGAQSARGCGEITGVFDVYENGILTKKISIGGWQPAVTTIISAPVAA